MAYLMHMQRKVVSYLINHHLDWECSALVKNEDHYLTSLASKVTAAPSKTSEKSLVNGESESNVQGAELSARLHAMLPLHNGERGNQSWKCQNFDAEIKEKSCISTIETKLKDDENCVLNPQGELPEQSTEEKGLVLALEERSELNDGASTSSLRKAEKNGWHFMRTPRTLKAPNGHYLVEEFISRQEEQDVLSFLDMDIKNPWKGNIFNGSHMSKTYGLRMDLKNRCVRPAAFEMPKLLAPILERMRANVPVLRNFWPTETNAIDYRKDKGHWIKPHVDDRQLSGDILVNLSMCGDCRMTYARERGACESYKILLPSRSIQVQSEDCRYNFTHSILNEDLLAPRRVSMTFRVSSTS